MLWVWLVGCNDLWGVSDLSYATPGSAGGDAAARETCRSEPLDEAAFVSDGTDPYDDCEGAPCPGADEYYGWVDDACILNDARYGDACNGAGRCRTESEDCGAPTQGQPEGTSRGVCQVVSGCEGDTAPTVSFAAAKTDPAGDCESGSACNGSGTCCMLGVDCECDGTEVAGETCVGTTGETWRKVQESYYFLLGGFDAPQLVQWVTADLPARCAALGAQAPSHGDGASPWIAGVGLPSSGGLPVNGIWTEDVDTSGSGPRAFVCGLPDPDGGETCSNSEPQALYHYVACRL